MTAPEQDGLVKIIEDGGSLFIGHPRTNMPIQLSADSKVEILRALTAALPLVGVERREDVVLLRSALEDAILELVEYAKSAHHDYGTGEFKEPSNITALRIVLALPHPGQPVEGWQLVPKEPTPEMLRAARGIRGSDLWDENSNQIWNAMLSAAPASPHEVKGSPLS